MRARGERCAPAGARRVTDSRGRAAPPWALTLGRERRPSGAGTEASFRRGSRSGPVGLFCPGPIGLAREAKASQHPAEPLQPLQVFLLPPKNGGARGVEEASIIRRSAHFAGQKLNTQSKVEGGGTSWRVGKWGEPCIIHRVRAVRLVLRYCPGGEVTPTSRSTAVVQLSDFSAGHGRGVSTRL